LITLRHAAYDVVARRMPALMALRYASAQHTALRGGAHGACDDDAQQCYLILLIASEAR